MFKKGHPQYNTGRTHFKKGFTPWNKGKLIKKICPCCEKTFLVHPYRKKTAIYCSISCKATYKPVRLKHGKSHTPEFRRYYCARRWALKHNADGSHTVEEWLLVKERHKFKCAKCGKKESKIKLTRDHIVPLSKGGTNYIDNIQPLCKSCNSKKRDKIQ